MQLVNFEFKAKTQHLAELEAKLLTLSPVFIGEDIQTDTYFNTTCGRLKLREGNIENALIWYRREDTAGAKESGILLYKHNPDKTLKDILVCSNGVKAVVKKVRRIYFIGNVKFHFDTITGLGTFIEVEAIDSAGDRPIETLKAQCAHFADFFGIPDDDYISVSYSDLILQPYLT